jgi:fumarylpyruvate hydrolase
VPEGGALPYPPGTSDFQHEVELVLAIGRGGAAIAPERALEHVFGYGVGIDLTRRDLQSAAKARGQPWEMGKAFDRAAPVSRLVPALSVGHPRRGAIRLAVNGVERQRGDLADMILPPSELIAKLSHLVELAPGDIVFTGTPAGVGPLVVGDRAWAGIETVGELDIVIVSPA